MNWFISEFNIRAYRLVNNFQYEKAPNVTLIYGPRGVGKSSLLHYVYQECETLEGKVITDAFAFARQYAFAAQEKKLNQFREKYRNTQLLVIDDLQGLAGKVKTLEELHFTYEYIIKNGGKLVIAYEADKLALDFLGDRLASRLLSGVAIPIHRPNKHELELFLEHFVHEKSLFVDPLALKEISERIDNLADSIKTVGEFVEFAELHQEDLSLTCFQSYWDHNERKLLLAPHPTNIIQNVSFNMGVPVEDLISSSRKSKVNEAREMAIYLIRTLCHSSFPAIGRYFNRNHNTMILSYQKMQDKLVTDQDLIKKYRSLLNIYKDKEDN